ncbi:MAG: Flp pilus assembly complex ATPase component TadA, partial [Candidatus Rokubacteria bacterium]|nr:Flp pilus assembly complex ATPase component TadA [Candidatus Rokubacteria bacterium]
MNPRLGELLVKEGLLAAEQLQKAVAEQKKSGERLSMTLKRLGLVSEEQLLDFLSGERLSMTLKRLGLVSEEQLLDFLSRKYGIPVINLSRVEVDSELLRLVRREIVQKYQVFPVRKVGNTLTLALSDPTVVLAIDDVQFATGLHVIPVLAAESAIKAAIDRHYDTSDDIRRLLDQESGVEAGLELVDRSQKVDIAEVGKEAEEAPIIRFVNLIVGDAIRKRASDIHLEPYEKVFRVRYRIDGVLHDVMNPPKQMEPAILSRVKIMANLDIAERRLPQDGR